MGKFVIKASKKGLRFDLKAANGQIVASGDDFYANEAAAKKAIATLQKNAAAAAVEDQTKEGFKKEKNPKFEIYQDAKKNFRFRLKGKNGQVLAVSEAYKKVDSAANGIKSVIKNSTDAAIVMEEAAPAKKAPAKKAPAKKEAPKAEKKAAAPKKAEKKAPAKKAPAKKAPAKKEAPKAEKKVAAPKKAEKKAAPKAEKKAPAR